MFFGCVVVVVVVSRIQRIGCQPEKTNLHGDQSRLWSAEQGKKKKKKSLRVIQCNYNIIEENKWTLLV